MNANWKFRGLVALLTVGTVASFAGGIMGTLSWFAYSTRATAAFTGTSVASAEQLQIGLEVTGKESEIETAVADEDSPLYELDVDTTSASGHTYLWNKAGKGFTSAQVGAVLDITGYSKDTLEPVTSTAWTSGSTGFQLKKAPIAQHATNSQNAGNNQFAKVPFAFRVIQITIGGDSYVGDQKIWLTDVMAEASGVGIIKNALRIYADDGTSATRFIINPSSTESSSDPRQTPLAGPLDLNGDGFYDTVETAGVRHELMYGYYTGDLPSLSDVTETSDVDISDNNVPDEEPYTTGTTFSAKHLAGTKKYSALPSGMQYAAYENLNTLAPSDDGSGILTGGKPVCVTDADTKVGRVDFSIYLEGWDHAVIDTEISHGFNLGLQFQINRVD